MVGATGKTGSLVVEQLLDRGCRVRAVARSSARLPAAVLGHPQLEVIEQVLLDASDEELAACTEGCAAVVSCLGHVMDFQGMFGEPRQLCTDAAKRLCHSISEHQPGKPVKFVMINSVGVANAELGEQRTGLDRAVLFLLRNLLPPHRDNECAADYLAAEIRNTNAFVEWCSVRPDSLVDESVSPYEICPSPVTGIFSGRPTARANVASFMADLVLDEKLWGTWKFRMPVIMNK